jgi:hypothetical protein
MNGTSGKTVSLMAGVTLTRPLPVPSDDDKTFPAFNVQKSQVIDEKIDEPWPDPKDDLSTFLPLPPLNSPVQWDNVSTQWLNPIQGAGAADAVVQLWSTTIGLTMLGWDKDKFSGPPPPPTPSPPNKPIPPLPSAEPIHPTAPIKAGFEIPKQQDDPLVKGFYPRQTRTHTSNLIKRDLPKHLGRRPVGRVAGAPPNNYGVPMTGMPPTTLCNNLSVYYPYAPDLGQLPSAVVAAA